MVEIQKEHPEIYFHVGLGKVASTYLQYAFFPKLKGVHYIQRTRFRSTQKIVAQHSSDRFFVSWEMDQQLKAEVERFAEDFPNTKTIILLRRHDDWIASQYRRHIKNGSPLLFEEFIDVEKDKGWWPKSEVLFYPKLKILEETFGTAPLVLFHDDLKKAPYEFMDAIANFLDAQYDQGEVSLKSIHTSYNEKQLKVMRKVARLLFRKEPNWSKNRFLLWVQRRGRFLLCYAILYAALLVPKRWVSSEPLISKAEKEKVRKAFEQDWEACHNYKKAAGSHSKHS